MGYPNWLFSLFSFVGFFLVLVPFPWHIQAWNAGTCLYMAWTAVACLNFAINSIIWNSSSINYAPVWCDISTRIIIGAQIAIPTAVFCILRRLYHISSLRVMGRTRAEKRRDVTIDLVIGLGIPILEMILEIISEGHRFDIYQEVGCLPFVYTTWVSILTVSIPPLVISLASAVYAFLAIRAFYKTRVELKATLSAYSNLTTSRYLRLISLCSSTIILTVPLSIYALYANVTAGGVNPWISWENTHLGYSRIDLYPSLLWRANPIVEVTTDISRWLSVFCALFFFVFFGFAEEARGYYLVLFNSLAKRTGIKNLSFISSSSFSVFHTQRRKDGTVSTGSNNSSRLSFSEMVFASQSEKGVPRTRNSTVKRSFIARIFLRKEGDESSLPSHYDDVILPDISGASMEKQQAKVSPVLMSYQFSASTLSIPETADTRSATETH